MRRVNHQDLVRKILELCDHVSTIGERNGQVELQLLRPARLRLGKKKGYVEHLTCARQSCRRDDEWWGLKTSTAQRRMLMKGSELVKLPRDVRPLSRGQTL